MGTVRAILWQHLWELGSRTGMPPQHADPNALVPASDFQEALSHHGDAAARREAGVSYARLWARTFPTLVRQAKGEPERMLAIFTDEVLPFLTGTRIAAKARRDARHHFTLVTEGQLDPDYVAGLLDGFLGLTGANVTVSRQGNQQFKIHARVHSRERAIRWMRHASQLRLPLLLTSALAAIVGMMAVYAVATPPIWMILATLIGTVAAQSGANAMHDLRHPRAMKLRPLTPSRGWLWFQFGGSFSLAGAALAALAWQHPATLAFAVVGILTASQYGRFRDAGLGPALAALTHGPLIVWGAAFAVSGHPPASLVPALLVTLPTGLLAAGMLQLDDIADRPLHEAAGRRTLVVRSTPQRSLRTLYFLLIIGTASAGLWSLHAPLLTVTAGLLVALAVLISMQVHQHANDPRRLTDSRILLAALYAATTLHLSLSFL